MISSPSPRRHGLWLRCAFAMAAVVAVGILAACSDVPIDEKYPKERIPGDSKPRYEDPTSIFGSGGLFGGDQASTNDGSGGGGIGVNSLLWRASLDTVSFMPLLSADPFGGVIITDWYSPSSHAQRALQGQHLHPRPPAAGRRVARHGLPPGQSGRRLGRCAGGAHGLDRSGERHPDARAPDADRRLAAVAPSLPMSRYNFRQAERKWQAAWAEQRCFEARIDAGKPKYYVHGDVPLSLGAHPYGPCAQLHPGRRRRPLQARPRLQRAASHGLGRLRPAGRERGHGEEDPSRDMDLRQHRHHARRS